MNTCNQEKYFSDIIKNDNPEILVDPGIIKRLEYALLTKAKKGKPVQHSIHAMVSSFFSLQYFGIKAGIITAMILFSVFYNRIPTSNTIPNKSNFLLSDSSFCDTVTGSAFDSNSIMK